VETTAAYELDLSISAPLDEMLDDGFALSRHPALRDFRARLGSTPLIAVPSPDAGARIVAKCEFHNPFGSVKDRAAYALFCEAITRHGERADPLKLVDFSGGNMARALSGLGALTGIPVRLAMPDRTPPSLLEAVRADGAVLDLVDTDQFLYGIIRRAAAAAAEDPTWTILHQHRNLANVAIHQFATGAEILADLGQRVPAAWIAAIGTGGTLAGVARALRARHPELAVIGVTPQEMPYGTPAPPNGLPKFAGSGGFGYGLKQPFVDQLTPGVEQRTVPHAAAMRAMREFRELTGMSIGASSAANWLIARDIAASLSEEQTVVTLFADAGTAEDWEHIRRLND